MNLKKAFDTVDHEIPLTKFDCSGIQSIFNNWFKSYLSNHKHFISVNVYGSELTEITLVFHSGLSSFLLLLYINDLNQAIKFCKVHRSTDDINFLYLELKLMEILHGNPIKIIC